MPKVAPWRLVILAKMAILAKIARGLAMIAINVPDPWRLAILAKMVIVAKLAILAKIARNACNGENGKKLPSYGDLNWMPKVAPWRLAMLAKMAILAKLAILAKIARGLAISRMWQNIQIGCQKWPLQSR